MRNLFFAGVFAVVITLFVSGCTETAARARRVNYVRANPELAPEQQNLILRGNLWTGMTKEEVRASLGNPDTVQEYMLDEREIWSYVYRTQLTAYTKYRFRRAFKLEFFEGRLINWRED